MALVLDHRSDKAGAAAQREEAKRYWRDADPDLPELAAAQGASR